MLVNFFSWPTAQAQPIHTGWVYDVSLLRPLSKDALVQQLSKADVVVLGEIHDNPHHHAQRAELLLALSANRDWQVVAEHLDAGQQVDHRLPLLQGLSDAGFDAQGWQWPMHEPLFQRIQQLGWPLWGGNLPAAQTRTVYQNQGQSLPEPIRALITQAALPEPAMANLRQSIDEGHCGALPAHMFDGMIAVQRARDAHMAQAVLMHTPAVLIAGNGHAWKDVGVPQILQAHRTELKVMSVLFLEEDPAEPLKPEAASMTAWRHKADYLWVTPAAAREDPCARWPKKQ
jgi:uncharacterized iron-regulated protein